MQWFLLATLCVAAICSATPRRSRQVDEEENGPQTPIQKFRRALHFYDLTERPNAGGDAVEVGCRAYFENVDVDVEARELNVDMYLIQNWVDPRLAFADDDDDEETKVTFKLEHMQGKIWQPDVLLPNIQVHGSTIGEFGRVSVSGAGEVRSLIRIQGRFRCRNMSPDMADVDCPIYILSAAYRADALVRQWREVRALRFNAEVVGNPSGDFVLDTTEGVHEVSVHEIPIRRGAPVIRADITLKIHQNPNAM